MKKTILLFLVICFTGVMQAQPAQYWRIVVTQCTNLKITELNFITPTGEQPSCNMRHNFDCSLTAFCTNQEEAFKPFDSFFEGNNGLFVGNLDSNSNYFVGLNFMNKPQMVSGLRFQKDSFNDITSFKIESSNDNINWKLHKTFSGLSGPWTDTTFFIDNTKPSVPKGIKILSATELPPTPSNPTESKTSLLTKPPKKFDVRVSVSGATDNKGVFQYQIFNALTNELIQNMPFDPLKKEDKFFSIVVEKDKGFAVKIITQDIYGNTSEKLVGIGGSTQSYRLRDLLILPLP